jgi:hypothetical protein
MLNIPVLTVSLLLANTQVLKGKIYNVSDLVYDSKKNDMGSWVWWYMPVIPALRRLRQEDQCQPGIIARLK